MLAAGHKGDIEPAHYRQQLRVPPTAASASGQQQQQQLLLCYKTSGKMSVRVLSGRASIGQ
jgi:hypothetical protein